MHPSHVRTPHDPPRQHAATLLSLTYVSSATALMTTPELIALLEESRVRNSARGITGLLLYCGGNIIQVLEGPEQAVRHLFDAIAEDPRHTGVTTAWDSETDRRSFPDWSMGFCATDTEDLVDREGFSTFLQERDGPVPGGLRGTDPARTLLKVFRDTTR